MTILQSQIKPCRLCGSKMTAVVNVAKIRGRGPFAVFCPRCKNVEPSYYTHNEAAHMHNIRS